MSLLDLLSSTVESLHGDKNLQTSLVEPQDSDLVKQEPDKITEILDTKVVEGVLYYLCKYQGSPQTECSWKKSSEIDCDELIEEYNANRTERSSLTSSAQEPDNNRKNAQLETVKEALRCLGGRAFGGAIVDWICENGIEMLKAYGGDRKKLRYCVNGLLSARVNAPVFEKKAYKENGSTKTEWMLTETYMKSLPDIAFQNINMKPSIPPEAADSNLASAEDSENSMDDEKGTSITPDEDNNNSASITTRSAAKGPKIRTDSMTEPNPYAKNFSSRFNKQRDLRDKRKGHKDSFDMDRDADMDSTSQADPMDSMEYYTSNGLSDATNGAPPTYRGMIKTALESLNGQGTFEAISRFIGSRFKDQLNNKADTWKHSIAGCLSVYFARREQKDNSGKVVWTLGEPPKPKRRGKKRGSSDNWSYDVMYGERESVAITRSSSYSYSSEYVVPHVAKRKKDDTVMVSAEHLEFLEEENECLKLLVAKKQREETLLNFHLSNPNINNNTTSSTYKTRQTANASTQNPFESTACNACSERHELGMMVNPCGHLFCGSVFCDQSTSAQCSICNAQVTGRIPFRGGRTSQPQSSKVTNQKVTKQVRSTSNLATTPSSPSPSTNNSVSTPQAASTPPSSSDRRSSLSSLASIIGVDTSMDYIDESPSSFSVNTMERPTIPEPVM